MSREDTRRAREALAQQSVSSTHKTALPCPTCGTIRTPGHNHKANDTGPNPLGLGAQGCNG